jgi:hypothetical protein
VCLLAEVHDQVAGLLGGPFPGGTQGDSEDANAPGGVLDHGQDISLGAIEQVSREEVAARIASAWERRNCDQASPDRRGAGSIPAFFRIPTPSTPLPSLPGPPARRGYCGTPIRGSHGPAVGPWTWRPSGDGRCRDASAGSCPERPAAAAPGAALGYHAEQDREQGPVRPFTFGPCGCRRCRTTSWWRRIKISAVCHATSRRDSRSYETTHMIRRKTNRRHMIDDHHGGTAGSATLLVTAMDETFGTHTHKKGLHPESLTASATWASLSPAASHHPLPADRVKGACDARSAGAARPSTRPPARRTRQLSGDREQTQPSPRPDNPDHTRPTSNHLRMAPIQVRRLNGKDLIGPWLAGLLPAAGRHAIDLGCGAGRHAVLLSGNIYGTARALGDEGAHAKAVALHGLMLRSAGHRGVCGRSERAHPGVRSENVFLRCTRMTILQAALDLGGTFEFLRAETGMDAIFRSTDFIRA